MTANIHSSITNYQLPVRDPRRSLAQKLLEASDVPYAERKQKWLREELGLLFDPFEHLDGGADPHLPEYLVDHGAFAALWGDWPTFLFALPGGGKTAFRVRLMRACRVGQEGRQIFPILFRPPRPRREGEPLEEDEFFNALLRDAGAGLFFQLAYQPYRFLELPLPLRRIVRQILEDTLPAPLQYYLLQLKDAGSLSPLAQAFDPTARELPSEPLPPTIRLFCEALSENGRAPADFPISAGSPEERFDAFTDLLFGTLKYESVYLLVDGADAYTPVPQFILPIIEPLLTRLKRLGAQKVFLKFFLPEDVSPLLNHSLLTEPTKTAIIQWDREALVAIIRERLSVASEGMYDGLEAIATPDAPRPAENYLAEAVYPIVPREILTLTQRVFTEHILRVGPYGRLERRDFEDAIRWYREQPRAVERRMAR